MARLPSTLKRVEYRAFKRCKDLKEIALPDGLEHIGIEAFCESGLEHVELPLSVRDVSVYAFMMCK